jgi:hypothetical protein
MDLRALMQKLETIDKTQIVTESVETKKVITESKTIVKESAVPVFKSAIARGLVEEFGYELEEETLEEAGNPWEGKDPAKAAAWATMSPEDQKWLGGADPTDKYILMRAPNKGKPAAAAPAPASGGGTKPTKENPHAGQGGTTPAPALVGTQNQAPDAAAQASRIADRMDAEAGANTAGTQAAKLPTGTVDQNAGELPGGAAAAAGQGGMPPAASTTGKPPAGGAGGDAAVKATREKLTALLDKLEKTGGVTGSAPAPAATAAPAKPSSGGATKQAAPSMSGSQSAGQSVGSAIKSGAQAVGDFAKGTYQGLTKESVTFEDDQTLLAIKNIRF